MHRFSVLKLCTATERVSYFVEDPLSFSRFPTISHLFGPWKWPPVSNNYKIVTIINSSWGLGGRLVSRYKHLEELNNVHFTEWGYPFPVRRYWRLKLSRDLKICHVSIARLLTWRHSNAIQMPGKLNAQFLKISWSDFPEIFTIGRGH